MNEDKLRNILIKYERTRDKNEDKLEERKNEVYAKIPQIKDIEAEISRIGLKMAKAVLMDPSSRDELVAKCQLEMTELKEKKQRLLDTNHIPKEYLNLHFDCDKCKDRAFLPNGEKCSCLKQQIVSESYKMSNLDRLLDKENFDNFNLNKFSTEIIEGSNISPRENMLNVLSLCDTFVRDFGKGENENLLFYGTTGLGKTYMCNCIAKYLLDRGYVVIYQTSFKILEILEDYKFRRNPNNNNTNQDYKNLFDCDLLVIDDLGTELNNSFTSSEIFNIVNTRLIAGKSIIISTNLKPAELGQAYTQRTLSRILDKFRLIRFIGNDLRWERS